MKKFLFLCLVYSLFIGNVKADGFHPFYLNARALAMGGAITAIPEDEQALFFNPAALAGVQKFSISLTNANADISNDLVEHYPAISNTLTNLSSVNSLNDLLGKNIYARGQATVSIVLPKFGFAGFGDAQVALNLKNKAFPQGKLGSQATYGGQVGFGFRILKLKKRRGELRFGVAGKLLYRAGGYRPLTLVQIMTLNTASLTSNMTNFGTGIGADAGLQFLYKFGKKVTVHVGLAYTDMGKTSFNTGADPQNSNLTAGFAVTLKNTDVSATLAYDYSNLLEYADFQRKMNLGLELKFPFLSLYAGLHQLNLTFGGGFDVGLAKIMYANYSEEQASYVSTDPERRHLLQAIIKFDL